jgi:hypothetical protein
MFPVENILPINRKSGFLQLERLRHQKFMTNAKINKNFEKANPGCQEWVISVESICADRVCVIIDWFEAVVIEW